MQMKSQVEQPPFRGVFIFGSPDRPQPIPQLSYNGAVIDLWYFDNSPSKEVIFRQ